MSQVETEKHRKPVYLHDMNNKKDMMVLLAQKIPLENLASSETILCRLIIL